MMRLFCCSFLCSSIVVFRDRKVSKRKTLNSNKVVEEDTRTPQLLDIIEVKGKEVAVAIAKLRN